MNQGCRGLVCGPDLYHVYLFYFLLKSVDLLNRLGTGATFKELSATRLKTVEIPVPPFEEQKAIVAKLDEAFAGIDTAIENTRANRDAAGEVFESYLDDLFARGGEPWKKRRVEEVCTIKHGFAFKSEFFADKGNYVLLTPGNFFEEGGYRDRGEKQKFYTGEIPDENYILSGGDLLVAMTEQAAGLLGSPILVPDNDKFLHNQRLGLVQYDPSVLLAEFLYHFFNTKRVRQEIHNSASGVKVRHTSPGKIGSVPISFPPLPEQNRIVAALDALSTETRRLTELYEQKLAALEELKQSLLQKAFAGELTD